MKTLPLLYNRFPGVARLWGIRFAVPGTALLFCLALLGGAPLARAAALTWSVGGTTTPTEGSGTWDTTHLDWTTGSAASDWVNGDDAVIGAGGALAGVGTKIKLDASITMGNLTFNAVTGGGTYVVSGSSGAIAFNGGTVTVNATSATLDKIPFTLGVGLDFTVAGSGTLILTSCTYSGGTGNMVISNGATVQTITSTGLPVGELSISNSATLDIDGNHAAIDALFGTGTIINSGGGEPFTNGFLNGSGDFSGTINSANFQLSKVGTGTQILDGINTAMGTVKIYGGALLINGNSGAATGTVTVETPASGAATFGGTGTYGGAVTFDSGASGYFTAGSPMTLTSTLKLDVNAITVNVPGLTPLGAGTYTLLTYESAGSSGYFVTNSPTITGAGLAAGGVATISTGGGTVTMTVLSSTVGVETAPDGSGTIVPSQTIGTGNSITVYAIERDGSGNFIANVAANAWSLINISGSVANGDLVPSGDNMSATFTGHLTGTAQVQATSTGLTAVPSGTLSVVGGATQVRVETAPDGSGTVVAPQNISAGASLTVYAVTRDAENNFVANVAASSWSLSSKSGGVANSDLVASADSKSAAFTGHLTGTATIHATSASLTTTDSGLLTVVAGQAVQVVFTAQPGGTITSDGTIFPHQPAIETTDLAGNPSTVGLSASLPVTMTNTSGAGTLVGTINVDLGAAASNGSYTFTDLAITGGVGGTYQLAAAADLSSLGQATLMHRWSFNGNLNDYYGGSGGVYMSNNAPVAANYSGNAVIVDGVSEYVSLGQYLISSLSNVTVEVWGTRASTPSGVDHRWVDFGGNNPGNASAGYLFVSPKLGNTGGYAGAEGTTNAMASGANNFSTGDGSGATIKAGDSGFLATAFDPVNVAMTFYSNGVPFGFDNIYTNFPGNANATPTAGWELSDINDTNCFIGKAVAGDPGAQLYTPCTIDEVRIWEGQLDATTMTNHDLAGPDEVLIRNAASSNFTVQSSGGGGLTAPTLTGATRLSDDNVQFTVNGPASQAYRIWVTSNVTLTPVTNTWTLLSGGTFAGSPVVYSDLTATNFSWRFYRVTSP